MHPDLATRLVLELSQRCWRTLEAEQAGALAGLRERGVAFSLDRAMDRGVRYVKLPAAMLLDRAASRGLDVEVSDLSAALARAGIQLIAERVEREEDVPDLIELDIPLGQGFVFAPPRPVRSDVLGAPVVPPRPYRPNSGPCHGPLSKRRCPSGRLPSPQARSGCRFAPSCAAQARADARPPH